MRHCTLTRYHLWTAIAALVLVAVGVSAHDSENPLVEILAPNDGATVRGTYGGSFHAERGEGDAALLASFAVYYAGVKCAGRSWTPPVPSDTLPADFCTFCYDNGLQNLKVLVYDTDGDSAYDIHSLTADNAYLVSVNRGDGSNAPASWGEINWKYWTGNGWSQLDTWCVDDHMDTGCSGWDCTTWGGAQPQGYCTGGCGHGGTPHTYCMNGDTPGYTGSSRDYPNITGTGGTYCTDLLGVPAVRLPATTACCGCRRGDPELGLSNIWIHGRCINGQCPDWQTELKRTQGCVRVHNKDAKTIYEIVSTAVGRVGLDDVHVSVPAGTWTPDE